jgi:DNA-binding CsgD family transcriptional regulator
MRALLRSRDEQKRETESIMYDNIKELVLPYLEKLRKNKLQDRDEIIDIVTNNLKEIASPLTHNLRTLYSELTPKEIQVINLIRDGRTSKEIAEILNVSIKAVEFHRENIRKKLGMRNKKMNLLSFLLTSEKS